MENKDENKAVKDESKIKLWSTTQLAEALGISARRIQQLTQDGVLKTSEVGRGYPIADSIQKYIDYKESDWKKKSAKYETLEQKKLQAEVKMKESKADMAALQLKEFQGIMHRAEDVEAMTNDLVFQIRSMMLALPGRLAIDVSEMTDANEISTVIKSEIFKVLNALAQYKYDAEEYKKRVNDRQGWIGDIEPDE